jgi:hypothetical protein
MCIGTETSEGGSVPGKGRARPLEVAVREVRDFEAGLAGMERLVEFIESPFLAVLKDTLPVRGMTTRPAVADPGALLVVGVASVIFGSDRAANRELRYHWDALVPRFVAAGVRVPHKPLSAQNFRDYRDGVLGGTFPQVFKETARDLFAGMALDLGLFPEVDSPWDRPLLVQAVHADGTKFAAASQVGAGQESRARTGPARVVADADKWTSGQGYTFCVLAARGPDPRQRVVLDVVHAPGSAEMVVVVPAAVALRRRLGDRFRCFVYDGAMDGSHHSALRAAGLMTANKPRGIRRVDQWRKFRDSRLGKAAKVFELDIDCECRHLFNLAAGLAWDIEAGVGDDLHRRRVLDVADIRRFEVPAGGYRWEADLVVRCKHGDHVVTVDPNTTLGATTVGAMRTNPDRPVSLGKATANLARDLRLVQVNDEEEFLKLFGLRNDSESGNNIINHFYLLDRANSFTAKRVDMDLWLYALMANTLAWREHCTPTGRSGRASR